MKKIVLVLTEAEAKALDHALGNTLNSPDDAADIFNTAAGPKEKAFLRAAYRARGKLVAGIRGETPARPLTNAEACWVINAMSSAMAGEPDGCSSEAEVQRALTALENARAKLPDGPFMAIPLTGGTLTQEE